MGNQKLLIVSIDGTKPDFDFGKKRGPVDWATIVNDLDRSGYCFAYVNSNDAYVSRFLRNAVLKFQPSKKYAFIYGNVTMDSDCEYCVCFDESEINPPSFTATPSTRHATLMNSFIPLLSLSYDLQLKIVETFDGVHLAKLACVCSQLRYLTSNDDLWKHRFWEEFSDSQIKRVNVDGKSSWKQKFVEAFKSGRPWCYSCSMILQPDICHEISNFVKDDLWSSRHTKNPTP